MTQTIKIVQPVFKNKVIKELIDRLNDYQVRLYEFYNIPTTFALPFESPPHLFWHMFSEQQSLLQIPVENDVTIVPGITPLSGSVIDYTTDLKYEVHFKPLFSQRFKVNNYEHFNEIIDTLIRTAFPHIQQDDILKSLEKTHDSYSDELFGAIAANETIPIEMLEKFEHNLNPSDEAELKWLVVPNSSTNTPIFTLRTDTVPLLSWSIFHHEGDVYFALDVNISASIINMETFTHRTTEFDVFKKTYRKDPTQK